MLETNKLYNMCCLEGMALMPDASADMVLCDLPYGATKCHWDTRVPFGPLWEQYRRVVKENGAILLFSAQPFTTDLINSNRKMFRYEIVWAKTMPTGFLNANKMPMKAHENILVFYRKQPAYNPVMREKDPNTMDSIGGTAAAGSNGKGIYGRHMERERKQNESGKRHPTDVVRYSNWNGSGCMGKNPAIHQTQKPVDLCEYLIRTYSDPGDAVLDNCMGSGTTAIAAIEAGRRWIGFEKDYEIYLKAAKRIEEHTAQLSLFTWEGPK